MGRAESPAARKNDTSKEVVAKKDDRNLEDFGGVFGNIAVFVIFHAVLFYLPAGLYPKGAFSFSWRPLVVLLVFHLSQLLFATSIVPGVVAKGLDDKMEYLCNGYGSLYLTLAIAVSMHAMGLWDMLTLLTAFPGFVTANVVLGNIYSVLVHVGAYATKQVEKDLSGKFVCDFFLGVFLHPRIGKVDIKMLAEIRMSWTLLMLITMACWWHGIQTDGSACTARQLGLSVMLLGHFMYVNACAKGEPFVTTTWDVTHERFGWMLCFANVTLIPMFYCYHSIYLARHTGPITLPLPAPIYYGILVVVLVCAQWIFDESNYEKNVFRQLERGRPNPQCHRFPTFRALGPNPNIIRGPAGTIVCDGWFAKARKINYAADMTQMLAWCLTCGFDAWQPYAFFAYFAGLMVHRTLRDEEKMAKKYGKMWEEYVQKVPYRFIPGLF